MNNSGIVAFCDQFLNRVLYKVVDAGGWCHVKRKRSKIPSGTRRFYFFNFLNVMLLEKSNRFVVFLILLRMHNWLFEYTSIAKYKVSTFELLLIKVVALSPAYIRVPQNRRCALYKGEIGFR